MLKVLFKTLAIGGIIIIGIMSFVIPKNPYKIIPSLTVMSCDKPLWLCIIIGISIPYLLILYAIYEKIEQRKIV